MALHSSFTWGKNTEDKIRNCFDKTGDMLITDHHGTESPSNLAGKIPSDL